MRTPLIVREKYTRISYSYTRVVAGTRDPVADYNYSSTLYNKQLETKKTPTAEYDDYHGRYNHAVL